MRTETVHSKALSISLEDKVAFLKRPSTYPDGPDEVGVIETHMSWVFLTKNYVYKLKKPVRSDFLDFSTLDSRSQDCRAEVKLNGRLAPDVYLETVPLTVDKHGGLQLDGSGDVVEWLVKMKRLPRDHMLDHAIQQRTVRREDVRRFSKKLACFYDNAHPIEIMPAAYCHRFEQDIQDNCTELSRSEYGFPQAVTERITVVQREFLERGRALLEQRARDHKIIEAHGDLRPEHVCMIEKPVFIDCLEFKKAFRILDPADELSYLAMECERLGTTWIGDLVFETYGEVADDYPPSELLHFYKSFRAALRAKITIWHLKDDKIHERHKWVRRTQHYLDLADKHAQQLR
ncbi:MAG: hypothetical protein OEU36_04565 [Gammaproteobacteria bacterium]|nr:hypothetical protein [Gammaproteobacteria bacterium]